MRRGRRYGACRDCADTTASAAQAVTTPARHWTTIETIAAGKQQACKVLANQGRAWTIYNRLDARQVKGAGNRLEATLTVMMHGQPTKRVWNSGWVRPGHISAVGTVTLPRVAGNGLVMTIHGTDFGNGGMPKIANIGRC